LLTADQLRKFRSATDSHATRNTKLIRHAANSAAVFFSPQSHLDMVRPGIAVYGIDPRGGPSMERPLRPVMKWLAPLLMIRDVAKGIGIGYGQTECAALATLNNGQELVDFPMSVGRPLPTVELEIRDPHGVAVPEGVEGEVCVRGPMVMPGYWRRPEATAETIAPGRWLRTGDIGRIQGGRLYLSSRKRDLIFRGGENVYPVEIEKRIEDHPDVEECAVIGVGQTHHKKKRADVSIPGLLSIVRWPPSSSASRLAMVRPRPAPCC